MEENNPAHNAPEPTPYVYSPQQPSQQVKTSIGNIEVDKSVDSFTTVMLVIFGFIMLFVQFGFILSVVVFYFAFRPKKKKIINASGTQQTYESTHHTKAGTITVVVIGGLLVLLFAQLINALGG